MLSTLRNGIAEQKLSWLVSGAQLSTLDRACNHASAIMMTVDDNSYNSNKNRKRCVYRIANVKYENSSTNVDIEEERQCSMNTTATIITLKLIHYCKSKVWYNFYTYNAADISKSHVCQLIMASLPRTDTRTPELVDSRDVL